MTTKDTLSLLGGALVIFAFPLSFLSRYLLYKHVGASETMWVLFFLDIPLTALMQIIGWSLKSIKEDK